MGTFDFAMYQYNLSKSPDTSYLRRITMILDHVAMDMLDWIDFGNSLEDTTTEEERVRILEDSIKGRAGLTYISVLNWKKKNLK